AVPIELLADTRSYELDPAVLYSGPERALDRLDDDLLVDRLLGRLDADQERVAGAELLDFDLAEAEGVHLGPHVGHVKGLRADDVDQIAAGEIDAEIEAAHGQRAHGGKKKRQRDREGNEALADKIDVGFGG